MPDADSLISVCDLAQGTQLGPEVLVQGQVQVGFAPEVDHFVADVEETLKLLLGPEKGPDEDLGWGSYYPHSAVLEASFH